MTKKLLVLLLTVVLPVCSSACLPSLTGLTLEDAHYAFELSFKGLLFTYLLETPVLWPASVVISLGRNLHGRTDYVAGQTYGYASIFYSSAASKAGFPLSDLFPQAVDTTPRFSFPITAASSTTLCVDSNANGRCDPGEPTLAYNSLSNQFTVNNPPLDAYLQEGVYAFTLSPGAFRVATGEEDFAGDIAVQISGTTPTWTIQNARRNFMFLRDAEVLPAIGFGNLGPAGTLTTQIVVNNPGPETVQGRLWFFRPDGIPLNVRIGPVTSSRHTFPVTPKSSLVLELDPFDASTPQTGWALGFGNGPLKFSTIFGIYANASRSKQPGQSENWIRGDLRREVGFAAVSRLSTEHILLVERTTGGIDTAFAIVNPTGVPANISLTLQESGVLRAQRPLTLGARSQTARFSNEFFGTNFDNLSGTLVVRSDTDVGVLALKTFRGEPSSSLPSGTR